MYQIGEFSLISRLSVKTLRYYHDQGILLPDYIDDDTNYRYYTLASVDKAAVITLLRSMEFSISEIKVILDGYSEDVEIVHFLEGQAYCIANKIEKYRKIQKNILETVKKIRSNDMNIKDYPNEIKEKHIDDIIFAGYRFKGQYNDIGSAFKIVGRSAGRQIAGKAIALYFDTEYKEQDADVEGGFPVSKTISGEKISCRILPGGNAVTIVHYGPYETLGKSYEKIIDYIQEKEYKICVPHREIYVKGPGIIFKGNPLKFITEIQFLVE